MVATALGVHVVKLFPASLGGPAFLKALRGTVPRRATSSRPAGSTRTTSATGSRPGAVAVGAGGELAVPRDALAEGDWAAVTARPAGSRRRADGRARSRRRERPRSGAGDGLRRGEHRRLVDPEGLPALGRRARPADPHAGRSRRRRWTRPPQRLPRAVVATIRDDPDAPRRAGHHPQGARCTTAARDLFDELDALRRDVRRGLLHRQARRAAASAAPRTR